MKTVLRIIMFILAIAVGGMLGYYLLVGFELSKMLFFSAACIVLGYLFHAIDKKISDYK